jgi:hypothetical protein
LTEWTVVTPLWDVWATLDWAKLWYPRKWHDWKHGMFTRFIECRNQKHKRHNEKESAINKVLAGSTYPG